MNHYLHMMLIILLWQVALAPPGTQACTLDIAKFHRTCAVSPDHKAWLVLQGHTNDFYIDHAHPFGASCASSNAGMIANAMVDIWIAEGVKPVLKYEDDLNILRYPIPDGTFIDGQYRYAYNRDEILHRIAPLRVPWHPEKGDPYFSSTTTFIGMLWDLDNRRVSLPEQKRKKFLCRVSDFIHNFQRGQCQLRDVERIHGSLCYISFIYRAGRSRLPSLSNFAASFLGDEFIRRYPPRSLITDLRWWEKELEVTNFHRQLVPRGEPLDLGIYVDASTSWGIGIIVEGKWLALQHKPSWKVPGRDIGWLETVAVELMAYILEAKGIHDSTVIAHSDNQGTIGSMTKGRSPNSHINLSIQRTYSVLCPNFITFDFKYIPSELNPADSLSRGELGPPQDRMDLSFKLPPELETIFIHAS